MFATVAPVNCVCLHPNQSELYIGDQSGAIYLWDLRAENADQQMKKPFFKVSQFLFYRKISLIFFSLFSSPITLVTYTYIMLLQQDYDYISLSYSKCYNFFKTY